MTKRAAAAIFCLLGCLITAFSTGILLFYYIAILLFILLVLSLACVLWTSAVMKCRGEFSGTQLLRGEDILLNILVRHTCLLPAGSVTVRYALPGEEGEIDLPVRAFSDVSRQVKGTARHVGSYLCGVKSVEIRDMFSFFVRKKKGEGERAVLSMPRPFEIEKPHFIAGDEGSRPLSRSSEDYTSPEDTRPYRPGDAMKRVHWKLSSRRRELVVRRYEMPSPPDTLILLDCALPAGGEAEEDGTERLRDALCETAVACADLQMRDSSPVRLPVYGKNATEFASDNAFGLHQLQEILAMQPFDGTEDFSAVLMMELRRMRRTGAVMIITTRLDAKIVDAVSAIRRMGPSARLYLCTFDAGDVQDCVARLQHHLVEVCYVTPN
ncbi:MAG: hypothetical protein CW338_00240 [Clostridiales bacterium]|nr:hypothetical protein [Clostridiales bacterium]